MAIAIEVYRKGGLHPGSDVENPLITTIDVAKAHGRNLLDAKAHKIQKVTLVILHNSTLRPGMFLKIEDPIQGEPWFGKIKDIEHDYDGEVALTTLFMEKYIE